MSDAKPVTHPGRFVKHEVIPQGMTVTAAAEALDIGRPALSNFLNGKAALSPEMAVRLEKAFGVSRNRLLDMQSEFDAQEMRIKEKTLAVRKYAPGYLEIKAGQIEAWSETIEARALLAVLLRKLVVTTSPKITKSDFPAYDNSQRPGWDGQVGSDEATPWIPLGDSGWEFGVNKDIKTKADGDYAKSIKQLDIESRRDMTFVFVTPRNWPGKDDWVAAKQKENEWKDVRAYDASNLEQWLEQSISAQAWLSERLGISHEGIASTDDCWSQWAGVCEPELSGALFDKAVEAYEPKVRNWLDSDPDKPLVIAADSSDEALAFAVQVLRTITSGDVSAADRAVVVTEPGALPILSRGVSDMIALVNSPDVELDLGQIPKSTHTIIIRHKGSMSGEPDIALGTVPSASFEGALQSMGLTRAESDTISRATGNSVTVLRRHLSTVEAIRRPPWSDDPTTVKKLVPLTLIGAWRADSDDDVEAITALTRVPFEESEATVSELLTLSHPPVWMAGNHRGMVSKIDALFAVAPVVTAADLENFFLVAQVILSEEDPALDLPEDKRWTASLYGKTRKSSSHLRRSLCETLVLLATHGNELFRHRLGYDVEQRINRLVRDLLTPLDEQVWNSQKDALPSFAEAAPSEFLQILEEDLASEKPTVLTLFRPAGSGVFGDCPRSGLLWALEALAWKPERLSRVASILAELSGIELDDNWMNKPLNSLESIFRSWMPQTASDVEDRKKAISTLAAKYPEIAWKLCVDQFSPMSRTGHYSYRPRFRNDALGAGEVVSGHENWQFARHAVDVALAWPSHDAKTLGDLIQSLHGLHEDDQVAVWTLVESWCDSDPDDVEKAELREKIRQYALTKRGRKRDMPERSHDKAREAYDNLAPDDLISRHQWLFAQEWVELSAHELEDDDLDYQSREERREAERVQAIEEIWSAHGLDGVLGLLARSDAAHAIGRGLKAVVSDGLDNLVAELIDHAGPVDAQRIDGCLAGLLAFQDQGALEQLIAETVSRYGAQKDGDNAIVRLLCCAPFRKSIWEQANQAGDSVRQKYWQRVHPQWIRNAAAELEYGIDELLDADRPRAALHLAELDVEIIESARLIRIFRSVATSTTEPSGHYRFADYVITNVLTELGNRKEVSKQELARLELLYISVLEHSEYGMPNLERELASSPNLFIEALAFAFRRSDGGEDPVEWSEFEGDRTSIAMATSSLLHSARVTPGTSNDDEVDRIELAKWVKEARQLSEKYGRGDIGDQMIGRLLSNSPVGDDGIWPCEAVRDVLEDTAARHIAIGMRTGVYNSRGVVWRGNSGDQERVLADKYRNWARQVAPTHPFTASVLEGIAESYEHDATRWDTDAEVRSRTGY